MWNIQTQGLGKQYHPASLSPNGGGIQRLRAIVDFFGRLGEHTSSKGLWALKDIDLEVREGDMLGIIGGNGVGKTTLLKILSGVTAPTTGEAWVRGRVVSLLELGTGFQPELSVWENALLNARLNGISRKEVSGYFDSLVAFAELEAFVHTPVRHFSRGMLARLAFANAIHMRPDILLADEILSVGDLPFQIRCIQRLEEMNQQGTTLLFVSHDMETVRKLCSRCIRLDPNGVVDDGAPDQVVDRYQALSGGVKHKFGESDRQIHAEFISLELCEDNPPEPGMKKAESAQPRQLRMRIRTHRTGLCALACIDLRAADGTIRRIYSERLTRLTDTGQHQLHLPVPDDLPRGVTRADARLLLLPDTGDPIPLTPPVTCKFKISEKSQNASCG
jgi:ABC-type polysaccharide/polyol phosphate transport system ATPase subunit